jgi:hypothetical protein
MVALLLGVTLAQIDSYIYSDDVHGSKLKTKNIVGDDPLSGLKGIISTLLGATSSGTSVAWKPSLIC